MLDVRRVRDYHPNSTERALVNTKLLIAFAAGSLCLSAAFAGPNDEVYIGGNLYTLNAQLPRATALAVRAGRVAAVGTDAEILALANADTPRHDLCGRTVLPGLIDAHGHLLGLGRFGLGKLDLSSAHDFDALCAMVARAAEIAKPGEWILGGRWDHESWPGKQLPTNIKLSELLPNTPVWLKRVDGHAGIANAAALAKAGVTREMQAPPGGEILRDQRGEPTGVLVDRAMELIERHLPDAAGETAAALLKAQELCFAAGLTGVHDAGVSPDEIAIYEQLVQAGALKLRVYAMVNGADAPGYFARHAPFSGERLSVRAAKLYADGALGSRGAWLLAPYADRPTGDDGRPFTGLVLTPPDELRSMAADGLRRGYQVCVHAIGDAANRAVLDAVEQAAGGAREGQSPGPTSRSLVVPADHRFRIEHAQFVAPADMPRFARLGVIASMQPTHCTSDMRWAAERLGPKRLAGAYAWKSLLDSGARLCGGSDFPVESHVPWLGIHAAVTRQTIAGDPPGGWRAAECLTREQAVRLFTTDAAYAGFAEKQQGQLSSGFLADFIVLDRDVFTCAASEIPTTKVLRTVVNGETVYAAE